MDGERWEEIRKQRDWNLVSFTCSDWYRMTQCIDAAFGLLVSHTHSAPVEGLVGKLYQIMETAHVLKDTLPRGRH